MVLVSLATGVPDQQKVSSMAWNPGFFRDESAELVELPWFKSFAFSPLP